MEAGQGQGFGCAAGDAELTKTTNTNTKEKVRVVMWSGKLPPYLTMHMLAYRPDTPDTPVSYPLFEESAQKNLGMLKDERDTLVHAMPDCGTPQKFMDSLATRGFAACRMDTLQQGNPLSNFLNVFLSERSTSHFVQTANGGVREQRHGLMLSPKPELLEVLKGLETETEQYSSTLNNSENQNFEETQMVRFVRDPSFRMPGYLHFDRVDSDAGLDLEVTKDGFQDFGDLLQQFRCEIGEDGELKRKPLPPWPGAKKGLQLPRFRDFFQLRLWMPLQGKKKLFVLEAGGRVTVKDAFRNGNLSILQEKGWISQPGQVVFFYNNMLQHAGVEAEDPPASGNHFRGIPHQIAPESNKNNGNKTRMNRDAQGALCSSASAFLSRTSHAALVQMCKRHIEEQKNLVHNDVEDDEPLTKRQRKD